MFCQQPCHGPIKDSEIQAHFAAEFMAENIENNSRNHFPSPEGGQCEWSICATLAKHLRPSGLLAGETCSHSAEDAHSDLVPAGPESGEGLASAVRVECWPSPPEGPALGKPMQPYWSPGPLVGP